MSDANDVWPEDKSNPFPLSQVKNLFFIDSIDTVIYRKYRQAIFSGDKIAVYGTVCGIGVDPLVAVCLKHGQDLSK